MFGIYYIYLCSLYTRNMAAQANKTGTNKNTTNEKEKKIMTVPL